MNTMDGINRNKIAISQQYLTHKIVVNNNQIFLLQGELRLGIWSWYSDDALVK